MADSLKKVQSIFFWSVSLSASITHGVSSSTSVFSSWFFSSALSREPSSFLFSFFQSSTTFFMTGDWFMIYFPSTLA